MKLIIDVAEKDYEWAKQIAQTRNKSVYCERQIIAISHGIPLDDVKALIDYNAEIYEDGEWYLREQLVYDILDGKYKAESEG